MELSIHRAETARRADVDLASRSKLSTEATTSLPIRTAKIFLLTADYIMPGSLG